MYVSSLRQPTSLENVYALLNKIFTSRKLTLLHMTPWVKFKFFIEPFPYWDNNTIGDEPILYKFSKQMFSVNLRNFNDLQI